VTNKDKPGFIGNLGRVLGEAEVNIARLNLGRDKPGGDAIVLVAVDERPSDAVLNAIEALPNVGRVHALAF
jgi:D-3-phosphoglycerate dehydrogenase